MMFQRFKKIAPIVGVVVALVISLVALAAGSGLLRFLGLPLAPDNRFYIPISEYGTLARQQDIARLTDELYANLNSIRSQMPNVDGTSGARDTFNQFFQDETKNLATDQYIKDNTRLINGKVGVRPPNSQFVEIQFSPALWNKYPAKNLNFDSQEFYSMSWFPGPRGFTLNSGYLQISEFQGHAFGEMEPATCTNPTGEMQRRAAALLNVSCTEVKTIVFPYEAGCWYLTRGEIQSPGPTAYLTTTTTPYDTNGWYPEPMLAEAQLVLPGLWDATSTPARRVTIRAMRGGGYSWRKENDEALLADWRKMVDDVSTGAISPVLDDYGACY